MDHYACAILIRDTRILLGRRAPHRRAYPNCWDVFGGKVEAEESVEAGLTRELGEELGIVPLEVVPAGVVEDFSPHARGHAAYHMFAVLSWLGEAAIRNREHTEIRWFSLAEACAQQDLALSDYRDVFERVLRNSTRVVP